MLELPKYSGGKAELHYGFAVALLTVAGALLRLVYINQPMRYDEAYSYLFFVQVPLASTLSDYSVPNQHILNSLLMRLSAGVFGNAPWALRLPAFIFGVVVIPATYLALRKLLHAPAALIAAALVAVSSQMILYSTNARGYSLIMLLFLSALGLSASEGFMRSERSWRWLVVVSVIGLYTIPTMLYAIGGIWLWHGAQAWSLWRKARDPQPLKCAVRYATLAAALTALLYTPVFFGTGFGSLVANDWVVARTPAQFVAELPTLLRDLWLGWHAGMPLPLIIALIVGVAAHAALSISRGKHNGLVLTIVLWCIAVLLLTFRAPFPRVLLFLLPLYFGIAASGILALVQIARVKATRETALVGALALSVWAGVSVVRSGVVRAIEGPLFPDAPAVVSYLSSDVQAGDGVYARTPADMPIWYYTWRYGLSDDMLRLKYNAAERILIVVNESDGQTIEQIVAQTPLPPERYSAPVLVRSFDRARVYEIWRLPPTGPTSPDPNALRSSNPVRRSRAADAVSAVWGAG